MPHDDPRDPKSGTVLIVDDSNLVRKVVGEQLRAAGYAVAEAASGEECLAWLETGQCDCVLLDRNMPGLDGLATLRKLRRRFSRSDLPVVMLTADADPARAIEALEQGANDSVVKSPEFSVLLARLESQVARKRSEAALSAAQGELHQQVQARTSELEAANRQLQAVQHQLGAALDAMTEELALFDADGRLIFWNAHFAASFAGSGPAPAVGDTFEALLRRSVAGGHFAVPEHELQAFLAERLEAHRRGEGAGELQLGDGRRVLVTVARTEAGGTLCVRTDVTEHRRSAEALSASQERLRAALQALPDLFFELDETGLIVDLHAPEGEPAQPLRAYLNRRMPDVMPPQAAALLEAGVAETVRSGALQIVNYTLPGQHGDRHYEARLVPLLETRVLAVVRDMTAAVRGRTEAEAQAHLLRQIIDTVPHWISVKDAAGNYLHLNRGLAQDLGVDVGELRARDFRDVGALLPPPPPRLTEMDREVLATGRVMEESALPMTLPDGRAQLRRTIKLPLRDAAGSPQGVLMWSEDVTERIRAEAEVLANQHLLRQIIDTLPHWISVKDRDGHYRIVNQAMARAHGVGVEAFQGRHTRQTRELGPGGLELMVRLDRKVLDEGQPIHLGAYTVTNLEGEPRLRRLSKFPLLGESGQVEGLVTWSEDVTEQNRSQEEVRANRLFLRQIMDAVPQWITVKDLQGRYLMVNRSVSEAMGVPGESFIGHTLEEIFHYEPGRLERIQAHDRAILETGRPLSAGDVSILLPDGSPRVRNMVKTPLLGEHGALHGVVTWSEDVTEARQAEQALRANRRLLRGIIDSLPFWISVRDRAGRYQLVNRAMAEALGVDMDHLKGRGGEALMQVLGASYEAMQQAEARVLATRQPAEVAQVDIVEPNREARVRRLAKFPLLDDENQVEGVVTWSEDITERLREEALMERSRRLMAQAEEVAHLGALEWNPETGEQYWSDSVYRLLGYEPQAFAPTAQSFAGILHPGDKKRVLSQMGQAAAAGQSVDLECRILRPDGGERILHARGEMVPGDGGRPTRMVGTVQDITESRKTEEEQRRAQRMEALGQFTGSVAHDFNNLLQIVNGYTHLARRREPGDARIGEDLKEVLAASDRGSNLARQLLAFSRRSHVQRRPLVLNDLVRGLEKMLRVAVGENVEVHLQLHPDVPLVEVDPGMIEQVLLNLAINARDAMPEGGQIDIETAWGPGEDPAGAEVAIIRVRDSGVGIPEEIRERIFEPYFSTKSSDKGTGLGLATVYGIVRQHNGEIRVESTVGRGTTFSFTLPAVDALAAANETAREPVARGGAETILVADNDPQLLRMMDMLLRDQGYQVRAVANGRDAVALVGKPGDAVALAVLDIRMPGMDGLTAGRHIRALHPELPIIYSTGDAAVDGLEELARKPGQYLLNKPFNADQLYTLVRSVLDARTKRASGKTPPGQAQSR